MQGRKLKTKCSKTLEGPNHTIIITFLNFRLMRRWLFWTKSQKKTKWLGVSHVLHCHLGRQQRYDFQSLDSIYTMGVGLGEAQGDRGSVLKRLLCRAGKEQFFLRMFIAMRKVLRLEF